MKATSEKRAVKVFRNGRNQAVRIPAAFALPTREALIWREGDRLVIEARPRTARDLVREMAELGESDFSREPQPKAEERESW